MGTYLLRPLERWTSRILEVAKSDTCFTSISHHAYTYVDIKIENLEERRKQSKTTLINEH